MEIIRTIAQMQAQARAWQRQDARIALVPTMGCLHEGHLSLVRRARRLGDRAVVSIFVNPTQFGPDEDLDAYPRTWSDDQALCEAEGVDVIFAPDPGAMYPEDASTWVVEEDLSRPLCGASRPGHFRGVTTVVAKLFLATLPDVAVFGQKDAQQALVIKRMVRDLNFPVEIEVAPIVREADGLAMSSRNRYLSADERRRAHSIHRGVQQAERAWADGEREADALLAAVTTEIDAAGGEIDYVELRDAEGLESAEGRISRPVLLAVAAHFGPARLIDNVMLSPHAPA